MILVMIGNDRGIGFCFDLDWVKPKDNVLYITDWSLDTTPRKVNLSESICNLHL